MIPEFDIYAAATAIIRQYGEEACLHATMRADALLKAGDRNGHLAFKRILRVIGDTGEEAQAGRGSALIGPLRRGFYCRTAKHWKTDNLSVDFSG